MVRNNFMMHICTVATLCFPEKTVPRNYYYCVQDDNSLSLCFKSMYRTLFVAIFTSTFIFSMSKSSHTYRNINISNLYINCHKLVLRLVSNNQIPLDPHTFGNWTEPECTESCGSSGVLKTTRKCIFKGTRVLAMCGPVDACFIS